MPRKDAILKIRLPEALKAEAERIAAATGETVAVVVRQALREYIDRQRERISDPPKTYHRPDQVIPISLVAEEEKPFRPHSSSGGAEIVSDTRLNPTSNDGEAASS